MKRRSNNKNLPYKEGTWFAIPLRQGGYATGRVVRLSGDGCILAYFFGPKRGTIPSLHELDKLTPDSAIKILRAGDLGIINGSWPIVGESPVWAREQWPFPELYRINDISKAAWRVIYADDNPSKVIAEERVPYRMSGYERDGLDGAGSAEICITRLLS